MSTIPKTREDLIALVETSFSKFNSELDNLSPKMADAVCTDGWTIKELIAVRAWWSEAVVEWIKAGKRGECPTTPAPHYRWNETPRLNNDIAASARDETYQSVRSRLQHGFEQVLAAIDSLDDRQLLEKGVFKWAGNWPISRWISVNTARQFVTARTLIRRAVREHRGDDRPR